MLPYLEIFGQSFSTYGIIGIAALVIAAATASLRAKKYNLTLSDILLVTTFAGGGIFLGGSLLYALVQLPHLSNIIEHTGGSFGDTLSLLFGGMIFYGGLFGTLLAVAIYAKFMKQDIKNIFRFVIPVFPLAHGIMRLGCFAVGCCYGIEHSTLGLAFTNSPIAPNDTPFIPVQLYESALNFAIFAAIWAYSKKERHPVHLICFYAMPYAIGRFALEFLRGDAQRGSIFGISTSQFISIAVLICCTAALIFTKKRITRS
ncbi:MAG: prolipoprotein diacylglyceryl transferase [Defluviitaleaceae bacterium]|nr:prolipoprotein diacylglyceryl transferase [Defluviitaleaceae bacterium]